LITFCLENGAVLSPKALLSVDFGIKSKDFRSLSLDNKSLSKDNKSLSKDSGSTSLDGGVKARDFEVFLGKNMKKRGEFKLLPVAYRGLDRAGTDPIIACCGGGVLRDGLA
jgi:hypothetical protein